MQITVSKIHELTGIDRRTITKRLGPLTPDNQGKQGHFYSSEKALPLVFCVGSQGLDPAQEKALLDRTRRELLELDLEIKRRNAIPADVVQTHWEGMIANTRAKLLNLPGRLATSVFGSSTVQDAERSARNLIHEALQEMSGSGVPE